MKHLFLSEWCDLIQSYYICMYVKVKVSGHSNQLECEVLKDHIGTWPGCNCVFL